ncbi:single-stranded DNA-binding protein [Streptomyces daliensis]|uniref:Single-stranded DNA-binding protein n=1 Tax=Streptomyces daliensis TaxID=299421 RepID=A0A8T4ILR7_9ACTN|nr:single-stranded DNA-binding protein [Streptomyces daliensis]
MHEAHVTVVGNAATRVEFKTSASGAPVARFRLASTVRRFDQQRGCWSDAYTSFFTVWAWRGLAANVASSVAVGEPVIVQGQLRIREGEKEGRRFVAADLTASTVGHDLSRGTSAFVRVVQAKPGLTPSPSLSLSPSPSFSAPFPGVPDEGERGGGGVPPGDAVPEPAALEAPPSGGEERVPLALEEGPDKGSGGKPENEPDGSVMWATAVPGAVVPGQRAGS